MADLSNYQLARNLAVIMDLCATASRAALLGQMPDEPVSAATAELVARIWTRVSFVQSALIAPTHEPAPKEGVL